MPPENNRFTLSWRTDRGPGADLRFVLQVRPGHDIYLSPLVLRSAPTRSADDVERLCSRYRGSEAPAEARDLSGLHLLPDSPHPQPVLQHDYDTAGALVVRTAMGSSTCTTVPRLPRDTVQQVHLEPQQASDGPEFYLFPLAATNADGVPTDAGIMAVPLDAGQRSAE